MRLISIKLSGFKSFVDQTTIYFPGQRIAIVGPNGCGKSNVMDAIQWVMGESQASQLRGGSIIDVIFNGSDKRGPLAQASVELLFDNTSSLLSGEYSTYSQISVKRVIRRDGQSLYFLNGTKCRRRDVTQLFLGTGLGPRSYAIISQGTISRMIEAKPEELRAYLEEVSGISKYKERRKETAQRVQATQENLERVYDLRQEIEQNLVRVEKQAKTAERYKLLKQEEKEKRGQYVGWQWQEIHEELNQNQQRLNQNQQAFHDTREQYLLANQTLEQLREQQKQAQQTVQNAQEQYHQISNNLEQVQQAERYAQEKLGLSQQELEKTKQHQRHLEQQEIQAKNKLSEIQITLEESIPEVERLKRQLDIYQDELKKHEQEAQSMMSQWQQTQQEHAKCLSQTEVAKAQIQHLENTQVELRKRQENLAAENQQFPPLEESEQQIKAAETALNEAEAALNQQYSAIEVARKQLNEYKAAYQQALQNQRTVEMEVQTLKGKLASLEQQQTQVLEKSSGRLKQWLKQQQLPFEGKLIEYIQVEAEWEKVVEQVLGIFLRSQNLSQPLENYAALLETLPEEAFAVFHKSYTVEQNELLKHPSLADKVQGPEVIRGYLARFFIADNMTQAFKLVKEIPVWGCVVTAQGHCLGPGWFMTLHPAEAQTESGILLREKMIRELQQAIDEQNLQIESVKKQVENAITLVEKQEKIIQQLTQEQIGFQNQLAESRSKLKYLQNEKERQVKQTQQILRQLTETEQVLKDCQEKYKSSREDWDNKLKQLESLTLKHKHLESTRQEIQTHIQTQRQQLQVHQQKYHQGSLELQKLQQESHHIQNELNRYQQTQENLKKRIEQLQKEQDTQREPLNTFGEKIDNLKQQKSKQEYELQKIKNNFESLEKNYEEKNQTYKQLELTHENLRNTVEELKRQQDTLQLKQAHLKEQFDETGYNIEVDLPLLLEKVSQKNVEVLQEQWQQVQRKIERLGPVNLVAIQEYQEILERKQTLDLQIQDLETALNSLSDAVKKIDHETRDRFKETFDQVNKNFSELFPSIFTGGEASLVPEDDNWLETGILVMARPPGKRNSTIHLLSGGEKALTALALVFALFKLNPAPFCLLDEVDAPLDDANIGRFCNLVKAMSNEVQFIFISHNKLAIEMAEQLVGITMREAGVSRLVAVDVHEAIAMAEDAL